jgi:DNA topoisomerase VI subunit B
LEPSIISNNLAVERIGKKLTKKMEKNQTKTKRKKKSQLIPKIFLQKSQSAKKLTSHHGHVNTNHVSSLRYKLEFYSQFVSHNTSSR